MREPDEEILPLQPHPLQQGAKSVIGPETIEYGVYLQRDQATATGIVHFLQPVHGAVDIPEFGPDHTEEERVWFVQFGLARQHDRLLALPCHSGGPGLFTDPTLASSLSIRRFEFH